MAINAAMRMALKALSYDGVKDVYKLQRTAVEIQKSPHVFKPIYERWDRTVICDGREVSVRIYPAPKKSDGKDVLLFFHGGGWVTESVNTYNNVCKTMAVKLNSKVVSVDYSLAPEFRFPAGLEDCYAVAKEVFCNPELLGTTADRITIVGDSAGGNLAAAVSIMARDRGEFTVPRQVLIYPATNNDHTENSQFDSVRDNGTDYLLTSGAICDYMELYKSDDEDYKNPYFAPLLEEDLSNQPKTLVISAQFDPLRDEGEAYGLKLKRFGNQVTIFRMKDSLHGFFSMNYTFAHVRKAYEIIGDFLKRDE